MTVWAIERSATTAPRAWRTDWLPPLLIALIGVIVFLPRLRAGFVSDAYVFLDVAQSRSPLDLPTVYIPSATTWYRPTTELVFWFEYRIFGLEPLGYHLVALLCHSDSALLLYRLTQHITASIPGAALAALTFLLTIHAHEIVWDIADLHNAIGGVSLLATICSYTREKRAIAFALAALTFTVDETGLLLLPIVGLYECAFAARFARPPLPRAMLLRLLPFAALTCAYIVLRLAPGGIYNQTSPCRDVWCVAVGGFEYTNRLFIRPEQALVNIWAFRYDYAKIAIGAVLFLLILLRPWTWRRWRPIIFAGGWLIIAVAYFVMTLFPYIADRFLYIPDMALALLVGTIAAEVWRQRAGTTLIGKAATVLVAAVFVFWLAIGVQMLWQRGQRWDRAGRAATTLLDSIQDVTPNPHWSALFIIRNLPDTYMQGIAPGNTGPYFFRNGLSGALRVRYGRADIGASRSETPVSDSGPMEPFIFVYSNDRVISPNARK